MNKKILITILISLSVNTLIGCSAKNTTPQNTEVTQTNSATYKYNPKDSRFKIVSVEQIDDGTTGGITISTLVDRETKVMYMQTEKYKGGYGIGLQVLVDKDGKSLIYNGKLD
jgi:hypothetical protein